MFTFLNIIYDLFFCVASCGSRVLFLYTYLFASVWTKCLWQWTQCRSETWLNAVQIFEVFHVSLLLHVDSWVNKQDWV